MSGKMNSGHLCMPRVLLGALLIASGLPRPACSEGGAGSAILNLPLSVRQAGMGNISAGGTDVLRAWSNPALLSGQATRGEVALGGASMFGGDQSIMGGGLGWMVSPSWTVGLVAMSYSFSFDALGANGLVSGESVERTVRSGGLVTAYRIGPVALGVGARGVADALDGSSASTIAADAGASATFGGVSLAAGVRNVGAGLRSAVDSGFSAESLPREIRAAGFYRLSSIGAAVGAEYSAVTGRDGSISLGAEWWPVAIFGVRAGAAGLSGPDLRITAGISAVLKGYGLDYALSTHPLGATHRASLSYAFGPTALQLGSWAEAEEAAEAARIPEPVPEVVAAPVEPVPVAPVPVVPPPVAPAPVAVSTRNTMAVAQFDPQNVSAGDAAVISDMFRNALVKQGRFDVVEKANMDKVLSEQAFQQSGCTTQECAVKLGKILNVKYLIVGSFGKLLDQYVLGFRVVETETARVVYSNETQELSSQRDVSRAIESMTKDLGRATLGR